MTSQYKIPELPLKMDLETKPILKQLSLASRALAELKGVAKTIPNETILLNTLVLQEAKDSSEVESIVTTQDELYRTEIDFDDSQKTVERAAAKEVLRYREAMRLGFTLVRKAPLLTNNVIKQIQQQLEENNAGFRILPGTQLKNNKGEIIYTPPQTKDEIERYMTNLEQFMNESSFCELDPLVKLPIIHHQFESIHPFYDGNGRTGRIICVLYLVANGLLDLPILYLSRYITHHKDRYYSLIQAIRDNSADNQKDWENWILFILKGIEQTANETVILVQQIKILMDEFKAKLKPLFGTKYNHELLNNLFWHPYTKIEYIQQNLEIARGTAIKCLDKIVKANLVKKLKIGKSNYYINQKLVELFINQADLYKQHVQKSGKFEHVHPNVFKNPENLNTSTPRHVQKF